MGKKKDRLKNKLIEATTTNIDAAGEIVKGDGGVVMTDEVRDNQIVQLLVEANSGDVGNRKADVVVDELDSVMNCNGQEEINRNTELVEANSREVEREFVVDEKFVLELGDGKTEDGKRCGNVEGGGVGGVDEKPEGGFGEASTVTRKKKRRKSRVGVVNMDEVQGNQIVKVLSEDEDKMEVEEKGNPTVELVVDEVRGSEMVGLDSVMNCNGQEEIDQKTEVEANLKSRGEVEREEVVSEKVVVEVGDGKMEYKTEVGMDGKHSGDKQGSGNVEKSEWECVGGVDENREGGGAEASKGTKKKRKRNCVVAMLKSSGEDEREVVVSEKCVVEVGDRETEDRIEVGLDGKCSGHVEVKDLVEKSEGEGLGEVDEKREGGGGEVSMGTRKKKKRKSRVGVVKMDEVQGNQIVELVSEEIVRKPEEENTEVEANRGVGNRKVEEFVVVDEVRGSELVELVSVMNCNGEEEIDRKMEVEVSLKSRGEDKREKCVFEVGDRKTEDRNEVGSDGKGSGDKQGNGNVEVKDLDEKQEGGGGEVSTVTKKKKKRKSRVVEEVERKRRCVLKEGGVDEKREVEVIDKLDVDVVVRDLVREQDVGGSQVSVEVGDQKQDVQGADVMEMKLSMCQRRELKKSKQKAWMLSEQANKKNHEAEGGDKDQVGIQGESTYVEKQDGEDVIERVEGESGTVKKEREIVDNWAKYIRRKGVRTQQMKLDEQACLHLGECSRVKIMTALNQFRISNHREYTFDATLTRIERAAIHLVSRKMGMKAKSSGSGCRRRISVYKHRVGGKETRKNNLTRFTLSEKAKDVSLNLFTRYPPYDCGLGGKMAGKFVGKIKRRKTDPFFSRPLMSKLDIRRKVDVLTSKLANDPKLKQIMEKRAKLPIASFRDAITSAIDSHQVVLISGETGCGKTTQVPQYVLDHVWSKQETCKIICTQPRRISAVSVAGRIAFERGENIGNSVGYKIKMESEGGRNSSIIFCTTGVLIRALVSRGCNSLEKESSRNRNAIAGPDGITHIIVDEVHERDHFSDLLLAIVRDLLPSNPNIRLVLMSATIDAERFSQYFGGCPVIRVPGFTYPVKTFYLEDILSMLKSNDIKHLESASRSDTSENFMLSEKYRAVIDDCITLAWSSDEYEPLLDLVSAEAGLSVLNFQHSLTGVTPLMVFSRKGRVVELCMALSLGADCNLQDRDGATALEWAKRENQREAAEILSKHMAKSVKNNDEEECLLDKYLATVNSELVDYVLIEQLVRKICTDSTDGAILVFLTGWEDIQKTLERLQRSSLFKDASKFLLLPLHSKVPSLDQKKVFERPSPGCRKIVLSTNIAESSITIDDVVYVINSGRMKEKSYDPEINVSTLLSSWISKANAKQRAGRAGRCQPGICYHLYSKSRGASFLDFQVPEVKRMPLEELCLQVKILDPGCKIVEFLGKLLDPPVTRSITNAISVLEELGALSTDEELTELGNKLGSLPVHPALSKMLFFAILFDCLDPALTLASVSSYRDPFYQPMGPDEKRKAMSAKLKLASLYGGTGDQLAVIAAFECWKMAQEKGEGASFCSRYYLSPGTMKMLTRNRKKFLSELYNNRFIPEEGPCCSFNAHDPGIRNAVLLAGSYPMVGKMLLPKNGMRGVVETAGGVKVRLNSSSTNHMLSADDSEPLVIFDEVVLGDQGFLIRNCSVVGTLPLLLLAKEIIVTPYKEDEDNKGRIESECPGQDIDDDGEAHNHKDSPIEQTIMSSPDNVVKVVVDRWLTFESTALDVAQICCLRERLSAATLFKIKHPFGTPSEISDASIHSIARILSYDGPFSIPPTLKYKEGTSRPDGPDPYLTSLMHEYHTKYYKLHSNHNGKASDSTEGGEASNSMRKYNSDEPAYCKQRAPPFERTYSLPRWI